MKKGKQGVKLTENQEIAIVAQRELGIPRAEIASAMGVSETTVTNVVNRSGELALPFDLPALKDRLATKSAEKSMLLLDSLDAQSVADAGLKDRAIAYGIVADKLMKIAGIGQDSAGKVNINLALSSIVNRAQD